MEDSKLKDEIRREVKSTQEIAKVELRAVEKDIKEVIRGF